MKNTGSLLWHFIEIIARWFLSIIFKALHKELTEEIFEGFMQFVKFGIVGVSNTVISYVIYVGALMGFKELNILSDIDYLIAQVVAFVLSVLWSFFWNNKYVFKQEEGGERSVLRALMKTYVSYGFTGLVLNSILLILWVKVFHISEFIAPIINLLISVPINFVINKFWAFKDSKTT